MSKAFPQRSPLRYDDLVAEARSKIPALAPEWTDHGPADTGMALIELLAWVTELLGYRATRQTESMTRAFLELLGGVQAGSTDDVDSALRTTLADLWTRFRAATSEDYVHLAFDEYAKTDAAKALGADNQLHRVVCLADRDAEGPKKLDPAPGHVSLVILRKKDIDAPEPLRSALLGFFEPRRLLATRVHVVGVAKVWVPVLTDVYLDEGAIPSTMHQRIWAAMVEYFSPYVGGPDGGGMPIGGEVFTSDLYRAIDALDGVDFVSRVEFVVDEEARRIKNDRGETVGLTIHPHELALYGPNRTKIRLFEPLSSGGWKEVSQ